MEIGACGDWVGVDVDALPSCCCRMQSALKITLEEFAAAFQRAKPPTGWGKTIGAIYHLDIHA